MAAFKYYLGLDMGTNSVGWAVTDPNYNLIKAKGKDLWGIREFNEASTAVERRTHRISRRRRQREQVRIGLLKDYFHDAICEVDSDFFQRLENSKYHLEDKDTEVRYKNNIFNDDKFIDKDYFDQYPTIYHLRKELIENSDKHDVRLVFLALLNMFKHRGHFLNAGLGENSGKNDINTAYLELTNLLSELTQYNLNETIDCKKMFEHMGKELSMQSVGHSTDHGMEQNMGHSAEKIAEQNVENDNPIKICPECNMPMQKRNGRYGQFWGCTGFPRCRHTENL